jgi:hypothetical protein
VVVVATAIWPNVERGSLGRSSSSWTADAVGDVAGIAIVEDSCPDVVPTRTDHLLIPAVDVGALERDAVGAVLWRWLR